MVAPHPLAVRLTERLHGAQNRVLDFASGSGRNAQALRRAGLEVVALDDRRAASGAAFDGISGSFAAVLSTHGLLHGTPATIAGTLVQIATLLEDAGLLYASFGSVRDARFGHGRRIDAHTYAPADGDERGVAHAFFDRDGLRSLLERHFTIESLQECGVDEIAGSWAHRERPLAGATHWLAVARKNAALR